MFKNLFSRKKIFDPKPTYKERVDGFYQWFGGVADTLDDAFESGDTSGCDSLREVGPRVDAVSPGMCWCFGPAMDKDGHHLAMSPEGDDHRLLLSDYWAQRAPRLPRWEFLAAKPGGSVAGASLQIGDNAFEFGDLLVALDPNEERKMPDVRLYHPLFAEMPENARLQVAFIALDEALGELGVGAWLGAIEVVVEPIENGVPLPDLMERVGQFYALMEWEMSRPTENWSMLEFRQPDPDLAFPQADSVTKVTKCRSLVQEHVESEGKFDDPLLESGAAYVYLAIPTEWFPKGEESSLRQTIEEGFEKVLVREGSGCLVGGGLGIVWSYIDLLIVDGRRSIELILNTAQELDLPTQTELRFFDRKLQDEIYPIGDPVE